MDQQHWETINSIVDAALNVQKNERERFIRQECRDDPILKREVMELLESMEKSDSENFLVKPADLLENLKDDFSGYDYSHDSSMIGKTIGDYKILELIAHGGMGSVFIAERTDDAYQKKVALKLLRRGMDTPSNVARFKRERNILADLDHPNITRLLDGGVTEEGLPFLVMDYVDGTPLFDYCNSNQLSIEERLGLFKTICKAVLHAHQNAVIHRDLKPSNILITENGKVKVLDFGIAKMIEQESEATIPYQTVAGSRILTLRYAAPEQITTEPITTATDTYALGILLYELLSGMHPFDFDEKNLREIEELIREKSAKKPSVKFKNLPEDRQKKIADLRTSDPATLTKALADDLDAIILKALRKEHESRYSSVEQLFEDLVRREKEKPVLAMDDNLRYRTFKFFRRRKKEIGVALLGIIIITGFLIFHTQQITQERNVAQQEARRADQVSSFLLDLFDTESTGDTLSAAGLLQKGMTHLQEMEDQPAHADMLSVMGVAYMNFGDYDKAEELLKKAIVESKNAYGEQNLEYATALFRMGLLYQHIYEWREAVSFFQQSYDLHSQLLGDEHFKTGTVLTNLATGLRNTGELNKAEMYARKAVEIHEDVLEPTDSRLLTTLANLAYVFREHGKLDEAESIYLKVIERARNNPSVEKEVLADYYNNLGYLYRIKEEYGKAVENYRNALHYYSQSLVKGHPEIIRTRKNLATSLFFQDSLKQTESLFKKNLTEIQERYSENHRRTATSLNTMGLFYLETGDFGNAESYLRKSVDINRDVLGPNHLWTAYSEGLLAASLKFQNQPVAEIESLNKHHIEVYKEHKDDLDAINKNQLNRLIRIYEKHMKNDSTYFAYQNFLN